MVDGTLPARRGIVSDAARAASATSAAPPENWQPLFDGRSLAGWKPTALSGHSKASNYTTGGHWRVENGTIGGILGERIWEVRGVRNYSFGATPDVITLNEHPQRCPVLPDAWKYFWRAGEWNEVRVRITGDPPTITTWVNGVQILQHAEPKSVHPARGHIGLQIHGGARSRGVVRYRNLRARVL